MSERFTCAICCDDYKVNDVISCNVCRFQSCVDCTKQFLLTTRFARCMNDPCRAHWSEHFIRSVLPKTWVNREYKPHVVKQILDLEESWMPDTMEYALTHVKPHEEAKQALREIKKNEKEDVEFQLLSERIKALDLERLSMKHKKGKIYTDRRCEIMRIKKECQRRLRQKKMARNPAIVELYESHGPRRIFELNMIDSLGHRNATGATMARVEGEDAKLGGKKIVMKCPGKQCNAYIHNTTRVRDGLTLFQCDVCECNVCKDCRQVVEGGHVCKESDVESVKAILSDTNVKPCPKCGEAIFRPFGCSHMWCTACCTSWDWHTQKIIANEVNTNPEYFKWRSQQRAKSANVDTSSESGEHANDELSCGAVGLYDTVTDAIRRCDHRVGLNHLFHVLTHLVSVLLSFKRDIEIALSLYNQCPYERHLNMEARALFLIGRCERKQYESKVKCVYNKYCFNVALRMLLGELNANIFSFMLDTMHFVNGVKECDIELINNHMNGAMVMVSKFNAESEQLSEMFGYDDTLVIGSDRSHVFEGQFVVKSRKHGIAGHGYQEALFVRLRHVNDLYCPYQVSSRSKSENKDKSFYEHMRYN